MEGRVRPMFRITQYRWTVCVLTVVIFITPRGGLFAATVNSYRKIVIFVDGTSLDQQRSIVTLLDPQVRILHDLTLVNGLAVQFSALVDLTTIVQSPLSHPEIQGVYQGDRILIPCNDVDRRLENDLIIGS